MIRLVPSFKLKAKHLYPYFMSYRGSCQNRSGEHCIFSGICTIQWLAIPNWNKLLQPTTSPESGGGPWWGGLKRILKRVQSPMDLICLCPRPCAKVFERDREPWWTKPVVWREIDRENIKKRLRKTHEIFVNQTNQKWWQTNQFNHKKSAIGLSIQLSSNFKKKWIYIGNCESFVVFIIIFLY